MGNFSKRFNALPPKKQALLQMLLNEQRKSSSQPQKMLRVGDAGSFPLSFAQERLWFLDQLEPHNPFYNVPAAVSLTGPLDLAALRRSLDAIIRRHEILRTVFAVVHGRPVQIVMPPPALGLPVLDLRRLPEAEREAVARRLAAEEAQRPFDLARGPLIRAAALRLDEVAHVVLLTTHHIVSDGWSMGVLVREVAALYQAFRAGKPSPLPELPIQYTDVAIWQRQWLQGSGVRGQGSGVRGQGATAPLPPPAGGGTERHANDLEGAQLPPPAGGGTEGGRSQESDVDEDTTQNSKLKTQNSPLEEQLAYWRRQLAHLPMLELPADRPRPPAQTFRGARQSLALSERSTEALKALSQREGCTLFMTLLAAFQLLLYRYTDEADVCVGTRVAGRSRIETEGLIGFFVNALVLRTDLSGNPAFRELLGRVRQVTLGAYAHQDIPFEHLVKELQPSRDLGRQPLFQVMFVLQNIPMPALAVPDLALRPLRIDTGTAKYDLDLSLLEEVGRLTGLLEYNTDLFDAARIERMLGHFQTLIEHIIANPELRIGVLPLLTEAERHQLLVEWNATQRGVRSQESGVRSESSDVGLLTADSWCIHQLFAAQAARTPDAVAVIFAGRPPTTDHRPPTTDRSPLHPFTPSPVQCLTYHELNARANRLAHHLREQGVGPEVRVGVCVERSPRTLIALLGILKAGGCYVPLDVAYPQAQLAFILEDTQVAVLLTTSDDRRPTSDDRPPTSDDRPPTTDHRPTTNDQRPISNDQRPEVIDLRPVTSDLRPQSKIQNPKSKIQNPLVIDLHADWPIITRQPDTPPASAVTPDHALFVMYTSGSTGRPKGVVVEQRQLLNRFAWMWRAYPFGEGEVACQRTTVSFTVSIWELLGPLLRGVPILIVPDEVVQDAKALAQTLAAQQVTRIVLVPSLLQMLLDGDVDLRRALAGIKVWSVGGEALTPQLLRRFRKQLPGAILLNQYGASELNDTAWFDTRSWSDDRPCVPIGRPIDNLQIYVLDAHMQPAPIGVPGQMYVGSVSLARGYLNRPDLTAERFVPNPFAQGMGDGGWGIGGESSIPHPLSPIPRLYKTGDLARYWPDGNIEYLGRRDHQVKVRGVRVELAGIEATLRQHPAVRESVVTAREESSGEMRLVAYVVPKIEDRGLKIEDSASDAPDPLSSILYPLSSDLRGFLRTRLPDYMVPAAFVLLEALPRTPNGKIDRRALPAPERRTGQEAAFVAPRTPAEELLARIWCDVLGLKEVGVHDNFFDLGGHSLLATQVVSRARDLFQVELPLRALFEAPTVAGLAERIAGAQTAPGLQAPPITPVPRGGGLPLSFAQQRLWFLDQMEPGNPFYNVPAAVSLTGPLDVAALQRSLGMTVRRHEALRTSFAAQGGQPVQIIAPALAPRLTLVDLRRVPETRRAAEAQRLSAEAARLPFDLARGPLLRATLLRLDDAEHMLLLTLHHIVSDGWSTRVFVREIVALYDAFSTRRPAALPDLPVQYADYAVWQRQWFEGSGARGQGSGARSQESGVRSQESDIGVSQIQNSKLNIQNFSPDSPSPIPARPLRYACPPSPLQAQLAYWKQQLADAPTLDFPTDRPRPAVQSFQGARQVLMLLAAPTEALRAFSQREGVTLFMTLLAAWQTLLARHSDQDVVVVGAPIAGRTRPETEGLIGFFVNTLVLRTDLSGDPTFRELLRRVREVCLGAYAHQDLPFEKLVEELQPARDLSRHPLFDVLFNYMDSSQLVLESPGLTLRSVPVEPEARFSMTLYIDEHEHMIGLRLVYQRALFSAERMAGLLDQFRHLLEQVVAAPERPLRSYSLVTPEVRSLLPDPGAPLAEPRYELVTKMFASWAERLPEQPALRQDGRAVTYGELERRAARLALTLLAHGAARGDVVAISGPRSFGLITSMMAALMSGGVMLTLDRGLPPNRQQLMCGEARVKFILYVGERRAEDRWMDEQASPAIIPVSSDGEPASEPDLRALRLPQLAAEDPAYIFFTSGTTGVPKGVLGWHNGLSHFLTWQRETFGIGPRDRSAQLTGLSFNVLLRDVFTPLTSGATLCLPSAHDDLGRDRVLPWMEREGITMLHTVPTLAQSWLADPPADVSLRALRWVFSAGEPLTDALVRRWRATFPESQAAIVLLYGQTETTLAKCFYQVPDDVLPGVQPAGRPIPHTQPLVLNGAGQLCGIGEPGELVLRTPFRTLGYINAPEEQRRRFVRNPFRDDARDMLYYTGDRGRYRLDGAVEVLGRADDQVKIRGMRVEPAEVQAWLCRHPAVREAVVLAREDALGEKRLVAYVVEGSGVRGQGSESTASDVLIPDPRPLTPELRDFLQKTLPAYMVPTAFMFLEALPLTPNGKVDRRTLPEPAARAEPSSSFAAPSTPVERQMAGLWSGVLGVERIGVDDNFFELGGHSLLATQLISRVRETFEAEVSLRSLFETPTIAGLVRAVEQSGGDRSRAAATPPTIRRLARDRHLAAVSAQGALALPDSLKKRLKDETEGR